MILTLLHDWDSLQSFKVRLCLAEKGVPWIAERVTLAAFEHLQPHYLALNPNGVVPTLLADGQPICESSIINEFIDDLVEDPPLKSRTPYGRARMRAWVRFEDDVVHPAVRLPTFNLMIKQRVRRMPAEAFNALIARHPMPDRAAAYRKAATTEVDTTEVLTGVATFRRIIDRMDADLRGSEWLAGDRYSLADIAMTPFVERVERLGMATLWDDRPHLQAWISRVRSRPSFVTALAPPEGRMPPPDPALVRAILVHARHDSPIQSG